MTDDAMRELLHQVNNLLGVIHAQAAAARLAGTEAAALAALRSIEAAAERTGEVVRAARGRRAEPPAGGAP